MKSLLILLAVLASTSVFSKKLTVNQYFNVISDCNELPDEETRIITKFEDCIYEKVKVT